AVEVRQPLTVLRRVEGEVPAVGLGVVTALAPHARVVLARRRRPLTGLRLALEEARRTPAGRAQVLVEQIDVVLRAAEEVRRLLAVALLLGRARARRGGQRRGQVGDAEVVDVALERPRGALVDPVVGRIAVELRLDQALA